MSLWRPAQAQLHQAGQSAVEFSVGALDGFKLPRQDNFGVFAGVAYSHYRSRYTYWKIGAHLNQKSYAYDAVRVPFSQWLGEAEGYTRLLGKVSRSLIINGGIGFAGGYETINQDRRVVEGATLLNNPKWVIGPSVGLEAEYLLTGRLVLLARVKEYYLFRSTVANTRFNAGVGIKFILPSLDGE